MSGTRQLPLGFIRFVGDLGRDVPATLRAFGRTPGFTTTAVLALAIGLGANSAIFSVVHAVVLKPLPYAYDSDRLVRLVAYLPGTDSRPGTRRVTLGFTGSEVAELRSRSRALSHAATVGGTLMGLTGRENAARLQGALVSASVFPMLGAQPLRGRVILESDEQAGQADVILLSHSAWQRYFAGDPSIVGRAITIETVLGPRVQRQCSVIGVMPPAFAFPGPHTQFWMPVARPAAGQAATSRGQLLARLADGVSLQAANDEIAPIVRDIRGHGPDVRYELVRERDEIAAPVRPALLVLTAAVGLVLLIACVNVTSLLLARATSKRRELAVRIALGAGRGRLTRQALTESAVLAALGGLAGLALAYAGVHLLRNLAPPLARMDVPGGAGLPRLEEVGINASVLWFTAVTALVSGLLSGLVPTVRQFSADPCVALRTSRGCSGSGSAGSSPLRAGLVVAQVVMTTMLAVGALLLIRSFTNLTAVDPGYNARNVLTFQVSLPAGAYPDERLRDFAEMLVARVRSLRGVRAAAYANQLPMVQLRDTAGGLWRTPAAGRRPAPGSADARLVSRDYFATMGIRVVAGRAFGPDDAPGRPRALVINEALTRHEFQDGDPVGRIAYVGRDPVPWQIVGVVANVRQFALDREPEPQFFIDVRQWAGPGLLFPVGAYYVARTDGDPETMVPALRAAVRTLDRQAALFNVVRMDALVASTVSRPRMYAVLLGIFAAVAVALAAIGIAGTMGYLVTQRTAEIGIRLALGARREQVLGLVLRQGLALATAGVLAGVACAAALARYLEGLLFGITPLDPLTFATASVFFAGIAVLASYMPARRATRIDPLAAIRSE
ncbi:MAG TPA: ABC transporter permease [Vicinamibacterales bacterium]|nr:ABC transporter permease [Vicinamibacterales bacterium]